jgi:hypothetical protein
MLTGGESDYFAGLEGPLRLVTEDITFPRWTKFIRNSREFHLTGVDWFKQQVPHASMVSEPELQEFRGRMVRLIVSRPKWTAVTFGWDTYALNQYALALSGSSMIFERAAQSIVLCEVIAEEYSAKGLSSVRRSEVYERMRIEPSKEFMNWRYEFIERLKGRTGDRNDTEK